MAKLKYTFDDYINNPSGKGSAVKMSSINLDQFEKELIGLESRNGKVTYKVYKQNGMKNKITYYIHFLIPSSTKGFFNDVVIQFDSNPDDLQEIKSIKKYTVKFFSNDSNFVYTYVYSFKSHGLLIKDLEGLLPFRSLNNKPVTRNPDNAMGYNKDIIFSYITMTKNNLFLKENLNRICLMKDVSTIKRSILPFDKKIQERNKITQELKDAAKKEKQNVNKNKIIKSKNLTNQSSNKPKVSKIVNSVRKVSKSTITMKKPKK